MFFMYQKILKFLVIISLGILAINNIANAATPVISSTAEKQAYQNKLDQLKAFVNSGVAYVHKYGKEKAFKEFSNPKGKFRQGDLYLFVYNFQGVNLAHGGDQSLIGKNLSNYHDKYGTYAPRLVIKVAKLGGGFLHYYWPTLDKKELQYKTAYVLPLDKNTLIGAGIYENIEVPVDLDIKIEELKNFVHEAKEYYKKHGEKAAFAEFDNHNGKFNRGTQYIFVENLDGVTLADGNPDAVIGDPKHIDAKDEFGTPYIRMFIEAVKSGGGLVTYYWPNSETHKIELKTAYVEPLTDNTYIGSGFFEH